MTQQHSIELSLCLGEAINRVEENSQLSVPDLTEKQTPPLARDASLFATSMEVHYEYWFLGRTDDNSLGTSRSWGVSELRYHLAVVRASLEYYSHRGTSRQ